MPIIFFILVLILLFSIINKNIYLNYNFLIAI